MNLRLAHQCTYVHRGPVVKLGLDVARGQEKREREGGREEEREKERRRQGRCLDNSCKVQLARMPATSKEENEGMQEEEKGRLKGSMWRVQEDEKVKEKGEREKGERGGGGKERHEEKRDKASRQREKESGVRTQRNGTL